MSEQKGGGGGRGGHGGGNKRPRVANQHNSLSKFQQSDTQSMDRRMNERLARLRKEDDLDAEYGYDRLGAGPGKTGFIFNLRQSFIQEEETGKDLSVVECYLVQEDGHTFKASLLFHPYFLVAVNPGQSMTEIEEWLARRFEGLVLAVCRPLVLTQNLPSATICLTIKIIISMASCILSTYFLSPHSPVTPPFPIPLFFLVFRLSKS